MNLSKEVVTAFEEFFGYAVNAGITKISDGSAMVAARFTQALNAGWSPNKILDTVKDLSPQHREWSKRVLDICLAEQANWRKQ